MAIWQNMNTPNETAGPTGPIKLVTHNDIVDVLEAYGLTLPRNAIEWRVPRDSDNQLFYGKHTALRCHVTLLLTDGVVCWFLLGDGLTLLHGHLSNFDRERETRVAYAGPRAKAPSQSRKRLLELVEED